MSSSAAKASLEERGEYGQVPLHEPSDDAAEVKKAAATAPPPGFANHPGMFSPDYLDLPWLLKHAWHVSSMSQRSPYYVTAQHPL